MANADRLRRMGKLGGGQAIDPVVGILGNFRTGMGDAGEVNHDLHAAEQRAPLDRAGEIGHRNHFDRTRKHIGRLAHRRAYRMSGVGKIGHQRSADEARCAGDQDTAQVRPRAKLVSRPPTIAAPQPSAITDAILPGQTTVLSASATSARLTANTRATISRTLKPRSVAIW